MDKTKLKLLLLKFEEGEIDAFEEIYEGIKTPVYTIIYRILYDHMMSEDLMQDVFLRLYRAPPPHYVENPRAWIFKMARNLAIDYKRRISQNEHLPNEKYADSITLENEVTTRLDIESALKRLTLEEREIVTLHLNAGMKFREIAQLMNLPLGTVLWRYQKSIGRLRNILLGGINQ